MIEFFYLILLGIIQGLTEFLPVSSSGHLAITQYFLNWPKDNPLFLDTLLHGGTLIATLFYFREKIIELLNYFFRHLTKPVSFLKEKSGRLIAAILIATLPTGIIGLSLEKAFVDLTSNINLVSIIMIFMGITLIRTKKLNPEKEEINLLDAFLVGIVQGIAVLPGISRSGSTIALLLFRGYSLKFSFLFSFLISLPAVFGATLLETLKALKTDAFKPIYLVGALISLIFGILALKWLKSLLQKKRFYLFGYYLIALGGIVLMLKFITKQ